MGVEMFVSRVHETLCKSMTCRLREIVRLFDRYLMASTAGMALVPQNGTTPHGIEGFRLKAFAQDGLKEEFRN